MAGIVSQDLYAPPFHCKADAEAARASVAHNDHFYLQSPACTVQTESLVSAGEMRRTLIQPKPIAMSTGG